MEFIRNLFTGSATDVSRYNLWGAAMLLVGILLNAFSRKLSEKISAISETHIRVAGLLLGILGALIAMKWI